VKVLECERFSCLHHDGAPLGRSRWDHSSWTSSVVASWAVFRLRHGGRQCWGSEKSESPRTRVQQELTYNSQKTRRQRISKRLLSPQKLWILLHVPLRPLL
jgi:hypothetical protein